MDHSRQHPGKSSGSGIGQVAALALAGGFGAGLLLWLLTLLVEQSGISGDGWSLRGNGALIVPFLGLPVITVAGTIILGRLAAGGTGRWWSIAITAVILCLSLIAGLVAGTRFFG